MTKKWLNKLLLLSLTILVVSGCGKSSDPTDYKEESSSQKKVEEIAEDQNVEDSTDSEDSDVKGLEIKVYFSNQDASGFAEENVEIASLSSSEVLKALIGKGTVSADVKLLSFTESEQDGEKVVDLNFSPELETYMKTLGTSGEYLSIGSICNTFLDAYDCNKVRITVDGKSFVTGHAEYPGYMGKFE